ncbi:hypothetical protein K7432_018513 [Basidiobolus ranarum]|uniref:Uncharacterized protein n=1 Tax=Basidiobolus ranarum TaxID=34480 RepID=A0ABR2WC41_9FUNG
MFASVIVTIDRIIEAPTLDEFITLLENGITEGCVHWSIVNSNTLGYFELNNRLTDLSQEVPLRADKLKIFILGRTTFYGESDNSPYGKMVWNNGNVLIVPSIVVYKRFFESEDVWNNLYEEYQRRRMHHYREKVNRHGHSNSLPSFWAFGYATLETMQGAVSVEFFQDYCSKHVGCCGL